MLHLKDLEKRRRGSKDVRKELELWHPLPMLFLKRYDFKRVRGWGSANDMIPWA
jgi:hypothetical protein